MRRGQRARLVATVLLGSSAFPAAEASAQTESVADTERAATPILPGPTTYPSRAYQLYWEVDVPVLGVAAVLGGARMARTEGKAPAFCVQQIPAEDRATVACDPGAINSLDRPFAGRWSESWSSFTDYVVLGMGAAPVAMLWIDEGALNMLNDVVVIYQATLISATLSGLSSLSAGRGRPYVYGTEAPLAVREGTEGGLAFFSGHTSVAFALATSTFWTLKRTHPTGALPWLTLGVGTVAASSVGLGRVLAGRHFPTDVFAGAIVGAGIGTLIPMLHGLPVRIIPELEQEAAAVSLVAPL